MVFILYCNILVSEGHALAKRLSKQITQVTKSVRTAIDEFNRLECSTHWPLPCSVEFDEIKNPEADLWLRSEFMGHSSSPPITIKRKAIDLYNLIDRTREEITLLQQEMVNVVDHFTSQQTIFTSSLADDAPCSTSSETRGRDVFLKMKLLSIESHLLSLKDLFQSHIPEITLPNFVFDKQDLPLIHEFSRHGRGRYNIISLPERDDGVICESDSEYETDDDDSAFFSL